MNARTMERQALKTMALALAYPELRRLPLAQWNEALKLARKTEFDLIERVGILAAIAAVAYLLRQEAQQAAALSLPVRYLAQFLAATLLIVPAVGPFYLRRTRRGLDHELERRRLDARFGPLQRSSHD